MEPSIGTMEQARDALARVSTVVEQLLQDQSFVTHTIVEMHAVTAEVLAFAARYFEEEVPAADHPDIGVFGFANLYFGILTDKLVNIDNVDADLRRLLPLCVITSELLFKQVSIQSADA